MAWVAPRTWVTLDPVRAPTFNTELKDDLSWLYAGEGWISMTLLNSWVNYSAASFGPARYRKVGPYVELTGLVKDGTAGTVIATLPSAYAPQQHMVFLPNTNNMSTVDARLDVLTNGNVFHNEGGGPSGGWMSLTCRYGAKN